MAAEHGSDALRHAGALLDNLRLLEAAGVCELISANLTEECRAGKPPEWWKALAGSLRTYRSAIHRSIAHGFSPIDQWSQSASAGSDPDLAHEMTRLAAEHRKWLCEVPGGQAYVAWLSAYVAVAEIDGERALRSLDSCAAIARDFVAAPDLGREPSVYDFLQSAANILAVFLPLPEHPLRDMRRFAFRPSPLRTGYGS